MIETGGPAFPHIRRQVTQDIYEVLTDGGMTLRDYFAAKAMQTSMYGGGVVINETIARRAYEMADAMLEARNA